MNLTDPINIMLGCCIPDKKRLLRELGKMSPGDIVRIEIDNCITSKAMVESFVKSRWCRIVETIDYEDSSVLHVRMDLLADHNLKSRKINGRFEERS